MTNKEKFKFTKTNVLFFKKNNSKILNNKDFLFLRKISKNRKNFGKSRICMHNDEKSLLNEMLIFHKKNSLVKPHKHTNKTESFFVIKGKLDIIFFDNKGNITKFLTLTDFNSKGNFYYQIPKNLYHTQIFHEDTFFLEFSKGPFQKKGTIIPKWFNEYDSRTFITTMKIKLKNFIN